MLFLSCKLLNFSFTFWHSSSSSSYLSNTHSLSLFVLGFVGNFILFHFPFLCAWLCFLFSQCLCMMLQRRFWFVDGRYSEINTFKFNDYNKNCLQCTACHWDLLFPFPITMTQRCNLAHYVSVNFQKSNTICSILPLISLGSVLSHTHQLILILQLPIYTWDNLLHPVNLLNVPLECRRKLEHHMITLYGLYQTQVAEAMKQQN